MDLGRGQAGAAGVLQGIEHVVDQAAHLGRAGVVDGLGDALEHGMPHAGDLEYGHGSNMEREARPVKRLPLLPKTLWFRPR